MHVSFLDIHVGSHKPWALSSAYKDAGLDMTFMNEVRGRWRGLLKWLSLLKRA